MLPNLIELENAAKTVYRTMPPTPQYRWPLLTHKLGVDVWLKHENHTPLGAFKVRGGLVYFDALQAELQDGPGVMCATRGNHGQSVAFAARQFGIPATIVVPHGNSQEKNAAMRALGAKLIEQGADFQEALEYAEDLTKRDGTHWVPSFDSRLIAGVGSYSLELLRAVPELDTLYVPIGLGSGICGAIAARNALQAKTKIVGVVSAHARAYSESISRGHAVEWPVATRIADGMACRKPNADALAAIQPEIERIIEVSDEEVEQAMRDIFECTHNVAEGAGAAAVAAVTQDAKQIGERQVAAVLCGSNVDSEVYAQVLGRR